MTVALPGRTETVTVITPATTVDRYGNSVEDWTGATSVAVPGCLFAPGGSSEDRDARSAVSTQGNVYAPEGTVVSPECRLAIREETWEVNGAPQVWQGLGVGGIEIPVRKVDG